MLLSAKDSSMGVSKDDTRCFETLEKKKLASRV
jgi:hypothetical protein